MINGGGCFKTSASVKVYRGGPLGERPGSEQWRWSSGVPASDQKMVTPRKRNFVVVVARN